MFARSRRNANERYQTSGQRKTEKLWRRESVLERLEMTSLWKTTRVAGTGSAVLLWVRHQTASAAGGRPDHTRSPTAGRVAYTGPPGCVVRVIQKTATLLHVATETHFLSCCVPTTPLLPSSANFCYLAANNHGCELVL